MIFIHLIILSLQINQQFNMKDIEHLICSKKSPKITYVSTDISAIVGKIVSTRTPQFAILSMESNRLHLFFHDNKIIYNCVWDGRVRLDEKKEILINMLNWWKNQNNNQFISRIVNYEDGVLFNDIIQETNNY